MKIFKQLYNKFLIFLRKIGVAMKLEYYIEYYFLTKDDNKKLLLPLVIRVSSDESVYHVNKIIIDSIHREYLFISNTPPEPIIPNQFLKEFYAKRYKTTYRKGRRGTVQFGVATPFLDENLEVDFSEQLKVLDEDHIIRKENVKDVLYLKEYPLLVINENRLPIDPQRIFPIILLPPIRPHSTAQ